MTPPTPSACWSPPESARRRCSIISTASSTTASPATGAASRLPPNEHPQQLSPLARPQRHGRQSGGRAGPAHRGLRGRRHRQRGLPSRRTARRRLLHGCLSPPHHRSASGPARRHLSHQRPALLSLVSGHHPRRGHRGSAEPACSRLPKCAASSPTAAPRSWSPTRLSSNATSATARRSMCAPGFRPTTRRRRSMDFVRASDCASAVSPGHHRSGRHHRHLSHLRHQRLSQGSGPLQHGAAGRALVHGACRAFPGTQGPCADRAALVSHHGGQHRALWPDGGHSRLLPRSLRRRRRAGPDRALFASPPSSACPPCSPGWSTAIPTGAARQRAPVALGQRSPALRGSPGLAPVRRAATAARRPAHSAGAAERLRHGGTGRPGHDGRRAVVSARQRRPLLPRAAVSHSRGR